MSSAAGSSEYTDVLVTHWFRPRRTCKQGVCQGVCESRNRIPCTCSRGLNLTYVVNRLTEILRSHRFTNCYLSLCLCCIVGDRPPVFHSLLLITWSVHHSTLHISLSSVLCDNCICVWSAVEFSCLWCCRLKDDVNKTCTLYRKNHKAFHLPDGMPCFQGSCHEAWLLYLFDF